MLKFLYGTIDGNKELISESTTTPEDLSLFITTSKLDHQNISRNVGNIPCINRAVALMGGLRGLT